MYTVKIDTNSAKTVVVDDMILTKDYPTTAGSKMLDGFMSLFDAEVLTRLINAGYTLGGKTKVGEFSVDLLGETFYKGGCEKDGKLVSASAEILKADEAVASVGMDINGSVRRAAAQNDLISIKPTYGTVSRYGTVPVACSGETVSVMAKTVEDCFDALSAIAGHDDKDGTSLPEEKCALVKEGYADAEIKKIAVLNSFTADDEVMAKLDAFCDALSNNGITVDKIDDDVIVKSRIAWNVLMSAELCNNVSRYDGVKYGYRAESFTNIDELYTNSRTEAFGEQLKNVILFGSETLSTENYFKVYDKALRTRRVIVEAFNKLFEEYDAVIIPACSTMAYESGKVDKYTAFDENIYTAPASVTGLPALVAGGVQVIGKAFSEKKLFKIGKLYEGEGK